jgi:branched-chain amino acid transport system permease protein
MESVIQTAIDAASLGSLYALMALGIALIFGIMRLVNFAHGELIMVGAYVLFVLRDTPLVVALGGTVLAVVVLALVMERVAFRPLRDAEPTTLLIASFAISFLLQNVTILAVGALGKSTSVAPVFAQSFFIGDLRVSKLAVITILVTAALGVALTLFFKKTLFGFQMRAAAEDFRMARMLGVRANTVIAIAFAMSGVLAAAVSILLVAQTGGIDPGMGLYPVVVALVATVVGGLASLPGAALGGFVLGCVTVLLQTALPDNLSPYRDAFAFSLVIVLLVFRPEGLMGRPLGGRVV